MVPKTHKSALIVEAIAKINISMDKLMQNRTNVTEKFKTKI